MSRTKRSLPDGKDVLVATSYEPWFETHGATGYVDPRILMPNPHQPRTYIDPDALAELSGSIAAMGVRDVIVVTPLNAAPWIKSSTREGLSIVSGHRRTEASIKAKVLAVPIEVRVYESEAAHIEDMIVLNASHANLSPLEEGYEIKQLLEQNDFNFTRVAEMRGKYYVWVRNRYSLTRLSPTLQAMIAPGITEKNRQLGIRVAEELGKIADVGIPELKAIIVAAEDKRSVSDLTALTQDERRFLAQELLLVAAKKKGHRSGLQIANFVQNHVIEMPSYKAQHPHSKAHQVRFEPRRRRKHLTNLLGSIKGSIPAQWDVLEVRRIFGYAGAQDLAAVAADLETCIDTLLKIRAGIRACQSNVKTSVVDDMPRVTYREGSSGWRRDVLVPLERYYQLEEDGLLEYQIRGTKKPDSYPDVSKKKRLAHT